MTYSWRVQFSALVGDKLFEAGEVAVRSKIKTQNVIEELELKVEFPDLRKLVNLDKIDFARVLEIRKKAKKFREWLQSESEREREAIWAYHREVARKSGFTNVARHTLKLFGLDWWRCNWWCSWSRPGSRCGPGCCKRCRTGCGSG